MPQPARLIDINRTRRGLTVEGEQQMPSGDYLDDPRDDIAHLQVDDHARGVFGVQSQHPLRSDSNWLHSDF